MASTVRTVSTTICGEAEDTASCRCGGRPQLVRREVETLRGPRWIEYTVFSIRCPRCNLDSRTAPGPRTAANPTQAVSDWLDLLEEVKVLPILKGLRRVIKRRGRPNQVPI